MAIRIHNISIVINRVFEKQATQTGENEIKRKHDKTAATTTATKTSKTCVENCIENCIRNNDFGIGICVYFHTCASIDRFVLTEFFFSFGQMSKTSTSVQRRDAMHNIKWMKSSHWYRMRAKCKCKSKQQNQQQQQQEQRNTTNNSDNDQCGSSSSF